jgi:predicted protein tyrosine phosphatase
MSPAIQYADDMRLPFVCSRNRLRSPTAEALFSRLPGVETASAGTSPDAENPVSLDLVDWADTIFVMEDVHRKKLNESFGSKLRAKKIVVLGIPDRYAYMDLELVRLLTLKLARHVKVR